MPAAAANPHIERDYRIWQVISASAVGTMIEWYDFYIFGSLATVISPLFYPSGNDTLTLRARAETPNCSENAVWELGVAALGVDERFESAGSRDRSRPAFHPTG
jgi:hypothetical protein